MSPVKWSCESQTLELRYPFTVARGTYTHRETVRLELDLDGITGWGEGAPITRHGESIQSTLTHLQRLIAGSPLGNPVCYRSYIERNRHLACRSPAALAAFDSAVLDWAGKAFFLPVHRLLGIDVSSMPPTSFTIGIDSPEKMAERAEEAEDFRVLKIKLGTSRDRELVSAIRDVTAAPLRVDANEGWADPETALREIEWLADRSVELVEQPLPAHMLEDSRWLKERSPLPLIADESVRAVSDLVTLKDAFHGINIKLSKCGGILSALELISLARAEGMSVMLGCMVESSCGLAAAAQLGPLVDYVDLDGNLLILNDPFAGHPVREGIIRLVDRPGTGAIPAGTDS